MAQLTTTTDSRALDNREYRLQHIEEALAPSSWQEIAPEVAKLRVGFKAAKTDNPNDAAMSVAALQEGLQGLPAWAVRLVVSKLLRGEIKDHDGVFVPTGAQLARWCRQEMQLYHDLKASRARTVESTFNVKERCADHNKHMADTLTKAGYADIARKYSLTTKEQSNAS